MIDPEPADRSPRKKQRDTSRTPRDLRKKAELLLMNQSSAPRDREKDPGVLLHELSVHQIELELQNEELKSARDEAELATEKYFHLYDLAPIGYAGFARDATITHINLTGAGMLRTERRNCIGRKFPVFVSNSDIAAFNLFLRKAFMSGKKESCEMSLDREGGQEEIVIKIEGIVSTGPDSKTPVCNAALIDITRQRIAEKDLLKTTHYLEALLDFANSPIVVWDSDITITRFNHAFERLTGRPAETVIGKPFAMLIPEAYRTSTLEFIRSSRGKNFEGIEIPISSLDNGTRILLWSGAVIAGRNGDGASTIAQGQDITERKLAEQELMERVEDLNSTNAMLTAIEKELMENDDRLKESLAEKEVLLGELHHKVKDNLTSFISLLGLESSTEDIPAGKEFRKDLENRAWSLALVHDTLSRTRQVSNVDMNAYLKPLVRQIVDSYPGRPRPIRISVSAPGIDLDINRATSVGMIVSELVTNSLKHAFPSEALSGRRGRRGPCTIEVTLVKDEGSYLLRVIDNGIGLRPGFNPLAAKSIGLKLVNFLAEHTLKAKVRVDSGEGTEFVLRFPEGLGN